MYKVGQPKFVRVSAPRPSEVRPSPPSASEKLHHYFIISLYPSLIISFLCKTYEI